MDANTELLLNITRQLGGLSANMETMKDDIALIKRDSKDHAGIHIELAPKKDIDELWVQIRKHDKVLTELKTAPGENAITFWKKAKDVFWASIIGSIALGFLGLILWSISRYVASGGKIN